MDERVIVGQSCLQEGAAWLGKLDRRFATVSAQIPEIPLRLRGDGFEALMSAIVSQQVSTASAAAIWARVEGAGLTRAEAVRDASAEVLAGVGLSKPKIRYAHALAQADLDYPQFHHMESDAVIKALTEVTGIGRWTAEIYVLFSLGRADVFPAGDLALQEAAKVLFDLDERPKERAMAQMAAAWSPWRGVAARLLWAYYRIIKDKEGIR